MTATDEDTYVAEFLGGPLVVVTGANGFVGSHACQALVERGAEVRAVVRRKGTAPPLAGVEEVVGDFLDPDLAAEVTAGADAVVATVHLRPGVYDLATQRAVGVDGTLGLARVARDAGVDRYIYISTISVYDPPPGAGDISESSPIPDSDAEYPMTKREAEAGLREIDGMTRIILRPPSILGPGPTSMWNTEVPARIRDHEVARHWPPEGSFAWLHVTDFASMIAEAATDLPTSDDPDAGPIDGGVTVVNVGAGIVPMRDYIAPITSALGVEPIWDDTPEWSGEYRVDRARRWGWKPKVDFHQAMAELVDGLRAPAGAHNA